VLASLLLQMHLSVSEETAPFEPEGGAYGSQASHAHDQGHEAQPHGAATAKPHARDGHDHGHVHGPGCNHDHH
jgi:urease accessory protein